MIERVRARVAEIEARFTPPAARAPSKTEPSFSSVLAAQGMSLASLPRSGPTTLGHMWNQPHLTQTTPWGPPGVTHTPPWGRTPGAVPSGAAEYQTLFAEAGARYGVDPGLLAAVAWTESAFNPDAVSHAGALGLMQIMPGTAAGLGVDPLDPAQAVDGAARYLRQQMDRFGDVRLALAAYNAGPGAVEKHGGIPPYDETIAYVGKVLDRYTQLRSPS